MPVFHGLYCVLTLWYLLVIFYFLRGFLSLRPASRAYGNSFSVVIAARNEEENIRACLLSVLQQSINSDRYEVIVVDDRSTDSTAAVVSELMKEFPTLRLVSVEKTPHGLSPKKYAVSRGVHYAKNTIVAFTDADCIVPSGWLQTLDRHFSPDIGLVQGITFYRYVTGINTVFFMLQSIDFLSHGIVAAAAIGAGLPLNSNANNFSFRMTAFKEAGGVLDGIGHVVSGDDDLLLQKVWRTRLWKISYMIESSGAVTTMPTRTFSAAFQQRARWGSKTVHYNPLQVTVLSGIFLFYTALMGTMTATLFFHHLFPYAILLFGIKLAGESLLMIPGLIAFGKKRFIPLLPVASVIQLPLVIAAVITGIFWKFNWKGQTFSRTIKRKNEECI